MMESVPHEVLWMSDDRGGRPNIGELPIYKTPRFKRDILMPMNCSFRAHSTPRHRIWHTQKALHALMSGLLQFGRNHHDINASTI